MGFKKGRAARASANAAAAVAGQEQAEAAACHALDIRHDGGSCVFYTAHNGSEYKIDVAAMEQTNVLKGTQKTVHRLQVQGKNWMMWQYQARRNGHKQCMLSQYPKWVGFALEERWKALQSAGTGADASERALSETWQKIVRNLDDRTFESMFSSTSLLEVPPAAPDVDVDRIRSDLDSLEALDGCHVIELSKASSVDAQLRQAVFDRLVLSKWPSEQLVKATRWLLQLGFQPAATHCRQVALSCGSVAVLRVLLMEALVEVCGLELLESSATSSGQKQLLTGNGGWIQHSKLAVKVLLARGAVLGSHASRSKLLKKLESDGDSVWSRRILTAMGSPTAEFALPDLAVELIADFLGLPGQDLEDD
eukprot:TRINITY_DN51260_c0_g1_i1.p1 TRINITY_DN51260_c0_g1~~TRINITY_DN51260_c0_g1_i1.p1  ORF type:complete len:365 (+),score=73.20 TRINITY_DN51260_c0_g1_i1:122-1216(+)